MEKVKSALAIILFGSVIKKEKKAKDIDALVVIDKTGFENAKKEIGDINYFNDKKIHPIYQTRKDLQKHVNEGNKVILNALKGIVVTGEDVIIESLQK